MPDTHDNPETVTDASAPPRDPAPGEVLRARPVACKVDRAALTREIICRFPKILAKLAE
jgi:hypothetical protein